MKNQKNTSSKMTTLTTIPKGRARFKNDLEFDFSNKNLVVITGINGCGKTTLLRQLYQEQKKINPNSVFFKTGNQNANAIQDIIRSHLEPS